jgi:hypothetical protein
LFRLVFESHDGRAPGADSEEKHEPASDIDTAVVDSLKAIDPNRPIREADVRYSRSAGATELRSRNVLEFGSVLTGRWVLAPFDTPLKSMVPFEFLSGPF